MPVDSSVSREGYEMFWYLLRILEWLDWHEQSDILGGVVVALRQEATSFLLWIPLRCEF